ncbi:MAG: hypothetical protein JWN02_194 [Acidobacteria bacterium]|nr:hypothetical protein [Acidobacteriota bacterium]
MKTIIIGAHLQRQDVEPVAEAWEAGDLFLSGLPVEDDQPLSDRDLLLRVAALRAELLERATFVAVRYGFAARSVADALARVLPFLPRWGELLGRHRHDVEMTLKVAASSPKPRPDRHAFTSGRAYLEALHEATQAASIDPAFREAVEEAVGSLAVERRWIHRDNASLELAALVPRSEVEAVRLFGQSLRERFPRVPFLLSGPWPLEVFADADRQ